MVNVDANLAWRRLNLENQKFVSFRPKVIADISEKRRVSVTGLLGKHSYMTSHKYGFLRHPALSLCHTKMAVYLHSTTCMPKPVLWYTTIYEPLQHYVDKIFWMFVIWIPAVHLTFFLSYGSQESILLKNFFFPLSIKKQDLF